MRRFQILPAVATGLLLAAGAEAHTLSVCPQGCAYSDIQTAADAAAEGDIVRLHAGIYTPTTYRDIAYGDLTLRGFILLDNRRLTIEGEDGAVLDGAGGIATSAFVIQGGDVRIHHLAIRNFHAVDTKDNIYDGHGIFQVGGRTRLSDLTIENVTKMALVVREEGMSQGTRVKIVHNGVGIWIDEKARLELKASLVEANTYSGLAVYASSRTDLRAVTFRHHTDDAVFIDGQARVRVKNSIFTDNKPFVFNLNDRGVFSVSGSQFCRNEAVSKAGLDALGPSNRACKE